MRISRVTSLWAQNVNSVDQQIVFMSSWKAFRKFTSSKCPEKIYLLHATSLILSKTSVEISLASRGNGTGAKVTSQLK
jgi:hypothetical protein